MGAIKGASTVRENSVAGIRGSPLLSPNCPLVFHNPRFRFSFSVLQYTIPGYLSTYLVVSTYLPSLEPHSIS